MPRFTDFEPKGVIPACLLPFHEDFRIDEAGYRKHLRDVVGVSDISAHHGQRARLGGRLVQR